VRIDGELMEIWPNEVCDTSICFLTEHIFGPLGNMTTFEERKGPEDFLLFVIELLQDQADIERAGVQKCTAVMTFSAEVWRARELGMCSSHRQNGGWRYQRRWYRQRRCVWYGQRGRISH